jgi:ribosome-binding protein aMBF1 (putative translation factor)
MPRSRARGPEPRGRNAIRTADPILRELFTIAHQKGIAMNELARRVDRTDVCVSRWKSGRHLPTMLDVVFLAQAIGCKIVVEVTEPAK